jgi:crotonobetainyl-CoA:carnitine CoA-transferase CaiB-like acyl-CoA transferase
LELLKVQVPCTPVNTVKEAFRDPQVAKDEIILEIPHPEFGVVR